MIVGFNTQLGPIGMLPLSFARCVIAISFLALALRGLAPVRAWGAWTSLGALLALAIGSCLLAAWMCRREGSGDARRDPRVFLLLAHFPIFALSYFIHGANHGVDAINHLEYIRSIVLDHDLDVSNDDAILGGVLGDQPEIDPTQINMHGIGPAFLWAPLYITANALCGVIGQACNGASRPYLAACTLTSLFFSSLGLVVAYRLALRFATGGAAFLSVLGIAWGTFLYWYLTTEPSMSHNLSFASAALTLLLIQRGPRGAKGWFVVGLSIGFSASVRFANALLGAPALFALPDLRSRDSRVDFLKSVVALAAGAFVAFVPQMLAWQQIFGSPLLVPNGAGFLDHPPALLGVLFSLHGGLFTWSPLLYFAVPGLLAFRRLGLRTTLGFWSLMVMMWITNARVPDWWGGSSFGNRRFCTILPIMAIGLAIGLDAAGRFSRRHPLAIPAGLLAALSLWNVLLAAGHRDVAWKWGEPAGFPQMARVVADGIDRRVGSPFSLPAALLETLRTGKPLAEYDAVVLRRPFSTFALRFGVDDAPFLGEGFSLPQGSGDLLHRSFRAASVHVVLRRAEDYTLDLRLSGHDAQSLDVHVNGARVGTCALDREARKCGLQIPTGWLRPDGVTVLSFRVSGGGAPIEDAGLYALWLRPRRLTELTID